MFESYGNRPLTDKVFKYVRTLLPRNHDYLSVHGKLEDGRGIIFNTLALKLPYALQYGAKVIIDEENGSAKIFRSSKTKFRDTIDTIVSRFTSSGSDEVVCFEGIDQSGKDRIKIDCQIKDVQSVFDSGQYKFESEYYNGGYGVHNHGLGLKTSGTIMINGESYRFFDAEAFRETAWVQAPYKMNWHWAHFTGLSSSGEKTLAILSFNDEIVNNIGGVIWTNGKRVDLKDVFFKRDLETGITKIFSPNSEIDITFTPRYIEEPLNINYWLLASGQYVHRYGDFHGSLLGDDNFRAFGAAERNEMQML